MNALRLTDKEFIRVSGPDTLSFLQGQVSCDMQALHDKNSLRGALCNLKGRVITDFRIIRDGEDCLLQTGPGMADVLLTVLNKYAVFSKVELQRDETLAAVFGVTGDHCTAQLAAALAALPESDNDVTGDSNAWIIRLPGTEPRFEVWCRNAEFAAGFTADQSAALLSQWQEQDILSGIIHIQPDTSEEFTPQLLNYDISGVINFKKGCYTGQEVVARMYFRSTAKKRMAALRSNSAVNSDSKIIDQAREKTFNILTFSSNAEATPAYSLMLAILDVESLEQGDQLILQDAPEATIEVLPLPYGTETANQA